MDKLVEASRERIERGSKSFAAASRLFDAPTRASAYMLYAWCRHCDDEIDGQELGHRSGPAASFDSRQRLEELRAQTMRALAGEPDGEVFEALARVVAEHDIPDRHPLEHLEGFGMDVDGRAYRTIDDTLDYSYHVAGVVGVMMAMVMGVRARETLNRASDLGIAFQLTNIARDIIPDAEAGRLYLPADWLAEAGVPEDAVGDLRYRAGVFAVAERLLDTADQYYASAEFGIPELPARAAWAIAAARNVYRDIGRLVRARGPQAWDTRAYVGRGGKFAGLALGGVQAAASRIAPARVRTAANAKALTREGLWTHPNLGEA